MDGLLYLFLWNQGNNECVLNGPILGVYLFIYLFKCKKFSCCINEDAEKAWSSLIVARVWSIC